MTAAEPSVVLHCHLCKPPRDGLIVTLADLAWRAAMEHAIDEHRPQFDAAPDDTMAAFTVSSTMESTPQPLTAPEADRAAR